MMFRPKLREYNINILIALFYNAKDELLKDEIKSIIIEKIAAKNYPIFYLITKFNNSSDNFKEIYADVILKKLQDEIVWIDINIIDEVLKFASLDALIYYGASSVIKDLSQKCMEEFYNRGINIEDKEELYRKKQKSIIRNKKIN